MLADSSPDKTCYVNMNKCSHQVLTVKAIHDPSMTRDGVSKVLQNKTYIPSLIVSEAYSHEEKESSEFVLA